MEVSYLTLERVIDIHAECSILTPGEQTHILDKNALESALQQGGVANTYLDNSDIFDIVSAVGWHLAKAHAFANANKRTSYFTTDAMLRANGYRLEVTVDEAIEVWFNIACNHFDKTDFAFWLRYNSYYIDS